MDINSVLPPSAEQAERLKRASPMLPDDVARDLIPAWIAKGETTRVANALVVDLMFNAAGELYASLLLHADAIDFDGVAVRTLEVDGPLKTQRTVGEQDRLDGEVLERALKAIERNAPPQ